MKALVRRAAPIVAPSWERPGIKASACAAPDQERLPETDLGPDPGDQDLVAWSVNKGAGGASVGRLKRLCAAR